MNGTRIDQDQSTWRRTVFSALMSKGLAPACDEADYIIIMAVPWIRMSNVVGMQQFHIEPGVMHNLRPFLRLHNYSLPMLYHTTVTDVLQDIALLDRKALIELQILSC
jgi:hypothetical protein